MLSAGFEMDGIINQLESDQERAITQAIHVVCPVLRHTQISAFRILPTVPHHFPTLSIPHFTFRIPHSAVPHFTHDL